MRIYGSSPLFNYVELIFRSKRVFIIAVVLGTALTSALVSMRPRQYSAELVIGLTPSPNMLAGNATKLDDDAKSAVVARIRRLAVLLRNDPNFVPEAARDAKFEEAYGARTDDMIRKLKSAITGPEQLTEDIVRVGVTWSDPLQAETFLKRVFEKFVFESVESETAYATFQTQTLQDRLKEAESEADSAIQRRVRVLQNNPRGMGSGMQSAQSDLRGSDRTLALVRGDMGEYQMQLAEVERQLRGTPQQIERSTATTSTATDPTFELKQQRDELRRKLAALRLRFSDFHPEVVDVNKQIASVDAEIAELASQPKRSRETAQSREVVVNPEWQSLSARKRELQQILRGMGRRLALLEEDRRQQQEALSRMPAAEVQTKDVERAYALKESMRNSLEAKLEAARMEEKQAKALAGMSITSPWEPKAELIETGGKRMVLYAAGPLLGLLIAFCFCLLAEALDHTLRTPVDVEKYLGKPVLAVIPRMAPARSAQRQIAGAARRSLTQ